MLLINNDTDNFLYIETSDLFNLLNDIINNKSRGYIQFKIKFNYVVAFIIRKNFGCEQRLKRYQF